MIKKIIETANPKVYLRCRVMTSSLGRIQTSSLFVPRVPLNLTFGTLSASFKFNNNVERWNWQSWFIHGRI